MGVITGARQRSSVSSVAITVGAEAADVINVALQFKGETSGEQGANLAQRAGVLAYLSDNDDGSTLLAAAHSGGVAVGTDGLAVELTADKVFLLVPDATGSVDVDITEAGAKTAHLVVVLPDGTLAVSGAITHAA